jgi:hypothetical protein
MGAAQVVVTIVVFAVLGRLLGLGWAVAIAAGMGLAMSSTAIGLATLAEKRLLQTPGGQASFSVLLFQDIAVIPLLLVLGMLSAAGDAHTFDWLAAMKAVALIAALIIAGRFLLRPLLRYIAQTGLREIFIAFALLLVIGIASLMHAVGLSMALGAFLAGVLLADSEYRHELELDIDPFKGLLLGSVLHRGRHVGRPRPVRALAAARARARARRRAAESRPALPAFDHVRLLRSRRRDALRDRALAGRRIRVRAVRRRRVAEGPGP